MEEKMIIEFLMEYTRGVDMINCVKYALDNNYEKPEDYDDFGCNIDFITKDKTSVKDTKSLSEWNVLHHNTYVKNKIESDGSTGFSFPPPYNFINESDIEINDLSDSEAEVEIENQNGTYVIKIEKDDSAEHGMSILHIKMNLPWGGGEINIIE
ncbi:MAG: hypothetical protein C0592_09055 [Marinilabiliales bacterium]|nr:MAG: hypothetical protein C0592_09055 [Marinilabiliales bacterium]